MSGEEFASGADEQAQFVRRTRSQEFLDQYKTRPRKSFADDPRVANALASESLTPVSFFPSPCLASGMVALENSLKVAQTTNYTVNLDVSYQAF